MNSTISQNPLTQMSSQILSDVYSPVRRVNEKPSWDSLNALPVSLEGTGVCWEGNLIHFTRSNLNMRIQGCPLVVVSQSVHLDIESSAFSVEILGQIEQITPLGDEIVGRWSTVQLTIAYDSLDDLRWQRLKLILRDSLLPISSAFLRGTLHPLDSGESLWKMKTPQRLLSSVSSHDSSRQRVEFKKAQISQPTTLNIAKQSDMEIVSTPLEIPNRHGQVIRAYHDAPLTPRASDSPVIILSPGYGETKREYIMLAYYFASNGFHVLRYDHTNHVGISDGEHVNTTLSLMREDLETVVNYVSERWSHCTRGLVATSLSGRVALKAIASGTAVDFLVLITPVVNVQQTLQAVHQEDLVGNYQKGERKGVSNVLGFDVAVSHWLADATIENFSDVLSTVQDASRIRTPVLMVSAECDAWVRHESVSTVSEALGEQLRDWYMIPEGLHRITENPRKTKHVYHQIMRHCQNYLGVSTANIELIEPTRKAIGVQNKKEREHMKASLMSEQLSEFWKDYLDHFHHIVNYGDYQQLLDHMLRLMGTVSSGESILDAGCGNGNFAPFFYLHERSNSLSRREKMPKQVQYVGIDFVPAALRQSQENFQTVVSRQPSSDVAITSTFSCVDLNQPLPFSDNTFDKIVSNLVLGYLKDPKATLRELFRVLAPNGTLVLSNLKPNSDLSIIYTNSVQETTRVDEIEEARSLLSNSGKIRQAEGDGVFQFHDKEELGQLLQETDPTLTPMVYSTFANQAYIAVIKKNSTSSSKPAFSTRTLANAA